MAHKALITGASSGIGEALALRLAQKDTLLYLIGRSKEKLEKVKIKVEKKGAECYIITGDVGVSSDVKKIVSDAVNKMQGINILIANAGVGVFKPLEMMTDEDFDRQFNTNVRGVFLFLREVVPLMNDAGKGQIIVTSSNLGFKVTARGSIYCATKFAVQAIVGCVREELKGSNVKVATINPGSVDTPWFADYSNEPKMHRLHVEEVVDAAMLIINQKERSNIDHILIQPTYSK